jgi:alanine-glyoxylate transaminase/serine-glyoxylate transaminase/serine-pyruvate transaminase
MSLSHGRDLLAIPGPSVIPDRVLRAMHRAAPNIYTGELVEVTATAIAGLRRVARTGAGAVAMYMGNGHAAWEAALINLFAPGHRVLVLSTGRFGAGWAEMARRMGIDAEVMDFGFRAAADPARLTERLRADTGHALRAVLTVQTDTASGVRNDIPALRAAIDVAGHPALFGVDCIASLACEPFEMDAWGVDLMVAACQKGLMTPPGLAFTVHGPRAEAGRVPCPSAYWDWGPRVRPQLFYEHFCGTAPTHHLYGLHEALEMILAEEGIEQVWARHAVFARAIWAAVERWGEGGALALNIAERGARSHAVTTIRTGPGEANRLRAWCETTAGLTLGVPLCPAGQDPESLFRIGHMGHLNPPMVLGALATIEAGLAALGIPHAAGGAGAAALVIAGVGGSAPEPKRSTNVVEQAAETH